MVSIFNDVVNSARKRSAHPIDYRCPFCGSREWIPRTRNRDVCYKYRCTQCKCEFDTLKMLFVVVDDSNDDKRIVECPSCYRLFSFGDLPIAANKGKVQCIQCDCEETVIKVSIDEKGNRIIDVGWIHEKYIKDKELN